MTSGERAHTMWAYRLEGPLSFARLEVPPPAPEDLLEGEVILEFLAGGICGSDIARCLDAGCADVPGMTGLSLHEIVGRVVASRSDIAVDERVVGWVGESLGLSRYVRTSAHALAPVGEGMDPVDALPLQPLACVLHGVERLPDLTGVDAAIIGLGPIGLLFGHVLRDRGVASITGVDLVRRDDVARRFGFDATVARHSRAWAADPSNRDRYGLVVEAVGHQVGTMNDALASAAPGGTVVCFGNPDDRFYALDFGAMMDKELTLVAGRTPQASRRAALLTAQEYLRRHPGLFDGYVTHEMPISDAEAAFRVAATPAVGRLKVALVP